MPGAGGAFFYGYNTVQSVNRKLALVMVTPGASVTAMPYVSDGTLAGTSLMDTTASVIVLYSGLVAANGQLFASGSIQPSSYGTELIATDAFATLGDTWCASVEEAIPDGSPAAGVSSRFRLPDHGTIATLAIAVDIGHLRVGDLGVTLRHAATGTEVTLLDRPRDATNAAQDCPGDLMDVWFDDAGAATAQGSCVDARLAYPRDAHVQPASPLAAFAGEALAGDWVLTATDAVAGSAGILHEWCLAFTTQALADRIYGDGFE